MKIERLNLFEGKGDDRVFEDKVVTLNFEDNVLGEILSEIGKIIAPTDVKRYKFGRCDGEPIDRLNLYDQHNPNFTGKMHLLYEHDNFYVIEYLEKRITETYINQDKCSNEKIGGGNKCENAPYHVYIVTSSVDKPIKSVPSGGKVITRR